MEQRLRDRVALACPPSEAQARIERFFATRTGEDGVAHVSLRVPMHGVGPLPSIALEQPVDVTIRRDRDEENLNDLLRIAWKPQNGPYPTFEGTLVTYRDPESGSTMVELDGTYDAPLSDAGNVFDKTIGHEIARRTATDLLQRIATFATH